MQTVGRALNTKYNGIGGGNKHKQRQQFRSLATQEKADADLFGRLEVINHGDEWV
jgi:hypothetical protein